jgi:alpha-galactosidase
MGDYYPLTPYNPGNDVWMAWQFNRPEAGEGAVQAFRRHDNKQESVRVKLHGLAPEARYTITNVDDPGKTVVTGRELLGNGLLVTLKESPAAAIIFYKAVETR